MRMRVQSSLIWRDLWRLLVMLSQVETLWSMVMLKVPSVELTLSSRVDSRWDLSIISTWRLRPALPLQWRMVLT